MPSEEVTVTMRTSVVCFASFLTLAGPAWAQSRLYVDRTATGANSGLTWTDAYNNAGGLQIALGYAAAHPSVTEIWVADGIYAPGPPFTNRSATLQLVNGVAIYGGFAGGETLLSQRDIFSNFAYLSGDLNGDDGPAPFQDNGENSYHVVTASGTNASARLDGFIVIGGNADGVAFPDFYGGGLYNDGGSPTLSRVKFINNRANSEGGGMFNRNNADPLLEVCEFTGNYAGLGGGLMVRDAAASPILYYCAFNNNTAANGAGLAADGSTLTLTGGGFFDNDAAGSGGAAMMFNAPSTFTLVDFVGNVASGTAFSDGGGGVYFTTGSAAAVFKNCLFWDNATSLAGFARGGGICNAGFFTGVSVFNCKFLSNEAVTGGGIFNGGGMTLVNSIFSGNSAESGGGYFDESYNTVMANCSFSRNTALFDGGGVAHAVGALRGRGMNPITNCIFWENGDSSGMTEDGQIYAGKANPLVSYSDVQGGWTGAGSNNINQDPLFIDADGVDDNVGTPDDNLGVQSGSMIIDAGNNFAVPADLADLDGDANTGEPTPLDLNGNNRFRNDFLVADTGAGSPPIVDMGAYEASYVVDCNNNALPDQCDLSCGNPAASVTCPGAASVRIAT